MKANGLCTGVSGEFVTQARRGKMQDEEARASMDAALHVDDDVSTVQRFSDIVLWVQRLPVTAVPL